MVSYIDGHLDEFGVEPICRVLQLAPSTYYAAKSRPPSHRQLRDEELKPELERIWKENYRVYGRRKLWTQALREGLEVGRDRVERLMKDLGITGAVRGKTKRTTISDPRAERPADPHLDCLCSQPAVGHGSDQGRYLGWCRLPVFHHRRLLEDDRRLAGRLPHAHRDSPRRPRTRSLDSG